MPDFFMFNHVEPIISLAAKQRTDDLSLEVCRG